MTGVPAPGEIPAPGEVHAMGEVPAPGDVHATSGTAAPTTAWPEGRRPAVHVLNGVNLGRLGTREPAFYGTATHADLVAACEEEAAALDLDVTVAQTDSEAEMVALLHAAADGADGVVLNAAAWTHYSVAVRDAAALLDVPFVEVHLSNTAAREPFRHASLTAALALGVVAGFGVDSYRLALLGLARRLRAAGTPDAG